MSSCTEKIHSHSSKL